MKLDPVTRRVFLQGAGKTLLALPFLTSFRSDKALAQAPAQQRFVFMGHIFGRDIDYWYPNPEPQLTQGEGCLYAKLSDIPGPISYSLSRAFDPVRNKISVLRGLDGIEVDNGHQMAMPLAASGNRTGTPTFGYSIDAVLEESRRFNATLTKLGALRTTAHISAADHGFSYSSKSRFGQQLQGDWSPRAIYDKYFNPESLKIEAVANARKLSVSNQVMEDFKRLYNSSAIAASDRPRLDNYMTLLSSVEARLGVQTPVCARAKVAPAAFADAAALQSTMIDLEVAALSCGITNVVVHYVLHYKNTLQYDGEQLHAAAHGNGAVKSVEDPGSSAHAYYTRWVMDRVAEMMTKLDAVESGPGRTLLDDSLVLYGNGESRGFHVPYDMPVVVGGGLGKLKTGYYIDYRPRPLNVFDGGQTLIAGRPYNNLLVTLFRALGFAPGEYQKFGRPGFGSYSGYATKLAAHYAPFLAKPDDTLPFLYG